MLSSIEHMNERNRPQPINHRQQRIASCAALASVVAVMFGLILIVDHVFCLRLENLLPMGANVLHVVSLVIASIFMAVIVLQFNFDAAATPSRFGEQLSARLSICDSDFYQRSVRCAAPPPRFCRAFAHSNTTLFKEFEAGRGDLRRSVT